MARLIAIVFLREPGPAPIERWQQALAQRWSDLPSISVSGENEHTVTFDLGATYVTSGVVAAPWPSSDLEGPCATSFLWPNAAAELAAHRAHCIVTVSGEATRVRLALLLTKAVDALLSADERALGVYWGHAALLAPKALFMEMAQRVLPHEPPLYIWVDFRVGAKSRNHSYGFTQGMDNLGYMDFDVPAAPESPERLRERLYSLARYVIRDDGKIRDGDTVGVDAKERIRVSYGPSSVGHAAQVMRLTFETATKKPWWQLI